MIRPYAWLLLWGSLGVACQAGRPECSGAHPDFDVLLELTARPLPPDTVVHVTYGGTGAEDHDLSSNNANQTVVFCQIATLDGGAAPNDAALTAAGAANQEGGVEALRCKLWTGGFAKLEVHATGLTEVSYDLSPREHECTVSKTLVLDSPDGG